MNRNWTPKSHVSVTDAGMVVEIELGGVQMGNVEIVAEADQMCIRGRHDDLSSFETRFGVPSDHSLANAKSSFANGILRIEVPTNNNSLGSKPRTMMIYCNECGKHFDIVVIGKGSKDYRCPVCGKVHAFDLDSFVNKAIEQSKKMLRKTRGRR